MPQSSATLMVPDGPPFTFVRRTSTLPSGPNVQEVMLSSWLSMTRRVIVSRTSSGHYIVTDGEPGRRRPGEGKSFSSDLSELPKPRYMSMLAGADGALVKRSTSFTGTGP